MEGAGSEGEAQEATREAQEVGRRDCHPKAVGSSLTTRDSVYIGQYSDGPIQIKLAISHSIKF